MPTQRRWLCSDCQREWLDIWAGGAGSVMMGADPWSPEMGCPRCKSMAIREHVYTPPFRGGDIPREPAVPFIAPSVAAASARAVQEPPLALVASGIPEFD